MSLKVSCFEGMVPKTAMIKGEAFRKQIDHEGFNLPQWINPLDVLIIWMEHWKVVETVDR